MDESGGAAQGGGSASGRSGGSSVGTSGRSAVSTIGTSGRSSVSPKPGKRSSRTVQMVRKCSNEPFCHRGMYYSGTSTNNWENKQTKSTNGSKWSRSFQMALNGSNRLQMVPNGFRRLKMAPNVFRWLQEVYMAPEGRINMNLRFH